MSTDSKEESVHIYLKTDDPKASSVLEGASAHEKYIILMNETLQRNAKNDQATIKDLENKVEELEDETDRVDARRNYLKSLVKNFHEMHKMNEKLSDLQSQMTRITQNSVRVYKSRAAWHTRILHCLLVLVFGLSCEFNDMVSSGLMGTMVIIVIAFHHSLLKNLQLPSLTSREERVSKLSKEKKKINDAQDYIHEFIESQ